MRPHQDQPQGEQECSFWEPFRIVPSVVGHYLDHQGLQDRSRPIRSSSPSAASAKVKGRDPGGGGFGGAAEKSSCRF